MTVCKRQRFPLSHPERLYSVGSQDERAGMGRYFYPFKTEGERGRESAKERRGVCREKDRKVQGGFWAEKGKVVVLTCLGLGEDWAGWTVCPSGVSSC